MDPHVDRLSFAAGPIPVRQHMDYRFRTPPGLIVVVAILRKAALIHDAEVRIDAGPAVRRWLALIVEPGPDETTGDERSLPDRLPGALSRVTPGRSVVVVRRDIALHGVVDVFATSRYRAGGLAPVERLLRMA